MPLYLIEGPNNDDVLSLDDAKRHMRVDASDDDETIKGYIAAAIQHVDGRDGWLGRALGKQTWELRLSAFCDEIAIPLPPLIAVDSVKYRDVFDAEQMLDPADYEVVGMGSFGKARIVLKRGRCWPMLGQRAENIAIRFRAGYGEDLMPEPIKQAVRLLVGDAYDGSRMDVASETVEGVGTTTYRARAGRSGPVQRLLAPFRVR